MFVLSPPHLRQDTTMRNFSNGPGTLGQTLSSAEVAGWLRVSAETIARLRRRGLLPARRVGGQWRYFPSEVLAALPTSGGQGVMAPGNPRRSSLEAVLRSMEKRSGDQT
jgi:excisionase family DNA binding protein